MSPVFATRRRAEEFDILVESSTDLSADSGDPRYADVLSLVEQLRALEPPAPRPDFTLALREQLMEAADTLLLPAADTHPDTHPDTAERLTLPPRRTARDRRIAAAVGAVAIVGASTSIAVAAQTALPGEMLYPIKRLLESAETGAHLSDSGKGTSLLSNAADRLAEVTALSRTSDLDESGAIETTLTTFNAQARDASDLLLDDYAARGDRSSIAALDQFTVSSMETLTQLEAVLPPGARDELQEAAQVLVEIDAAASAACPVCRGGLDQIPAVLLSVGQLSEPTVVVPASVDDLPASDDGRRSGTKEDGSKDGSKDGVQGGGDAGIGPITVPDVPASGDTGDDPTGPLDGLLDGVTGQGGEDAANGGGGFGGNDGSGDGGGNVIDDTVEDVIDLIEDPLAP